MQAILILSLFLGATSVAASKDLEIHFIDVEIGNAVLLVTPYGESLLMDAGSHLPNNRDRDRVVAEIRKASLSKLDYVVATHYHNDHYGAIADLAELIPITNFVDHGPSVEYKKDLEWWNKWFALFPGNAAKAHSIDETFERYRAVAEKSHHIVVKPGDSIPLKGLTAVVVTSAGRHIATPLPGGGTANPVCASTGRRTEDLTEDGQSVGLVIAYGKFRFINLGDLTWNDSLDLFCPKNPIGKVELYMVTHHGMSDAKEVGEIDWGRSCCSPPELMGLSPRVAVESGGPKYHKGSSPAGWQAVHSTPSVEDIWQTNYHVEGGKENNAPDRFIANVAAGNEKSVAHSIVVTAERNGNFGITNERTGYHKDYDKNESGHH